MQQMWRASEFHNTRYWVHQTISHSQVHILLVQKRLNLKPFPGILLYDEKVDYKSWPIRGKEGNPRIIEMTSRYYHPTGSGQFVGGEDVTLSTLYPLDIGFEMVQSPLLRPCVSDTLNTLPDQTTLEMVTSTSKKAVLRDASLDGARLMQLYADPDLKVDAHDPKYLRPESRLQFFMNLIKCITGYDANSRLVDLDKPKDYFAITQSLQEAATTKLSDASKGLDRRLQIVKKTNDPKTR